MEMNAILCLVFVSFAVFSAQALSIGGYPQCLKACPMGQLPDRFCRCPGLDRSPCDVKFCRRGTRCVERYNRAVCVPSYPSYPTEPSLPGFPTEACHLPSEPGMCLAYIPRYFYNSNSGRCEEFIYGGCGGNANNFDTLRECRATCSGRVSRRTRY